MAETTTLTLGYVQAESVAEGTGLGAAGFVSLAVGPVVRPVTIGEETRASLLLPIHIDLGYQYLQPAQPASGADGPETFHIGRFGVGIGLGAEVVHAFAAGPASEVGAVATVVVSPGLMSDFSGTPFEPAYGQRTVALDVELRATRVAGTDVGVAVGYSRHVTRWSPAGLGEGADVLDSVTADGFVDQSRFGLFRLGVTL